MLTLVRYAFTLHRGLAIAVVALAIVSAGLSVLLTTLIGQVVGALPAAVRDGSYTSFAVPFAALVVVFASNSVVPLLQEHFSRGLLFQSHRAVAGRVAEAVLRPVRSAHLEDPEVQDHIERARGTSSFNVEFGLSNLYVAISMRLTALGLAAVVGVLFSWWVALGLLISVALVGRACAWAIGKEFDSYFTKTDDRRRSEYLFELGMGPAAAELRVFGLSGWLLGRHHGHWSDALRPLLSARRRAGAGALLAFGLHFVVSVGALALVGQAALAGTLSLAAAATLIPTVLRMAISQDGQAVATMSRGLVALRAVRELPALIEQRHPVLTVGGASKDPAITRAPAEAIRFERVCFRYPGGDRDVLHELDLEIRSGEALALVGVNGAGKSTLVKLLAGTYVPTGGRITVDGIDLASLDPASLERWQRRIAPIVQEFARFPLPAIDNVVLGAVEHRSDTTALDEVAAQAGIDGLVERMPDSWETVLNKKYEGGVDLSGGEWQRIALARALFAVRAGAGVLVLDEPAAALDVRAEARLVDRYLELTSGVTSLIISHRFSVVREAHRICVLEGGRIVESGDHAELIAAGGRYAAMFRLQAERYGERRAHA